MDVLSTRLRWGWSPVLLALLVALSGCRIPPFNADLAAALSTAGKMEERARFTVGVHVPDHSQAVIRFVPDRPGAFTNSGGSDKEPLDSGFVVVLWQNEIEVLYSPENGSVSGGIWAQKPWSPGDSLQWRLEAVGDGFERSLAIIGFGPPNGGGFELVRWDYSRNGSTSPLSPPPSLPYDLGMVSTHGAGPVYVSMHTYPTPLADLVDVYALYYDGSSVFEDDYTLGPMEIGPNNHRLKELYAGGPPTPYLSVVPGNNAYPYYRNRAADLSYLSVPDGVGWKNYRWQSRIGPVTTLPSNRRLDAIFTTGELYSGGGGWGSVLDKNGNEKYRFPLGDLRLAYECYLKGTPTLVFTLVLPKADDDSEVEIRVYTLPTRDVGKLAH